MSLRNALKYPHRRKLAAHVAAGHRPKSASSRSGASLSPSAASRALAKAAAVRARRRPRRIQRVAIGYLHRPRSPDAPATFPPADWSAIAIALPR